MDRCRRSLSPWTTVTYSNCLVPKQVSQQNNNNKKGNRIILWEVTDMTMIMISVTTSWIFSGTDSLNYTYFRSCSFSVKFSNYVLSKIKWWRKHILKTFNVQCILLNHCEIISFNHHITFKVVTRLSFQIIDQKERISWMQVTQLLSLVLL